jgi:hypothetical protein
MACTLTVSSKKAVMAGLLRVRVEQELGRGAAVNLIALRLVQKIRFGGQ